MYFFSLFLIHIKDSWPRNCNSGGLTRCSVVDTSGDDMRSLLILLLPLIINHQVVINLVFFFFFLMI